MSNDLFDEPNEQPRPQPEPQANGEKPQRRSILSRNLGRRKFLLGAGTAAVAGAVVGAGATVGVGALLDDDDPESPQTAQAVPERDGMTLGAPEGRAVSGAVVRLKVNGQDHWVAVDANETLAEVLRRKMGLTGTKIGCDRSECSACAVLLNGQAVNSCSTLAIREDGKEVLTIEGIEKDGELSAIQQAFLENMGLQCGFCTPGQIIQATALLAHNPQPTEEEIRREMSGNLCKCSAYPNIMAAIKQASGTGSV